MWFFPPLQSMSLYHNRFLIYNQSFSVLPNKNINTDSCRNLVCVLARPILVFENSPIDYLSLAPSLQSRQYLSSIGTFISVSFWKGNILAVDRVVKSTPFACQKSNVFIKIHLSFSEYFSMYTLLPEWHHCTVLSVQCRQKRRSEEFQDNFRINRYY